MRLRFIIWVGIWPQPPKQIRLLLIFYEVILHFVYVTFRLVGSSLCPSVGLEGQDADRPLVRLFYRAQELHVGEIWVTIQISKVSGDKV